MFHVVTRDILKKVPTLRTECFMKFKMFFRKWLREIKGG